MDAQKPYFYFPFIFLSFLFSFSDCLCFESIFNTIVKFKHIQNMYLKHNRDDENLEGINEKLSSIFFFTPYNLY